MTKHPIITISRECGSGGHDIAELLSKKLGYPMYDNNLLTIAARESGYTEEAFSKAETAHTSLLGMTLSALSSDRPYNMPLNNQLFSIQFSIIRTIADRESAIIVGRCADAVLRDYAPCINIFIQGDPELRLARVMKRDGLLRTEAARKMNRVDKSRATYYNFYTDSRWGLRTNYDLIVSSDIGVEATADLIAAYVEKRLPQLVAESEAAEPEKAETSAE